MIKIKDIVKGSSVEGFYLVKSGNIKISSNGKQYGDYIIADSTGEINAKLWDVADEKECPATGTIIKIKGLVTEWQGVLQLRIDKFRAVSEEDEFDIMQIIPSAPESPDDMLAIIKDYVNKIENSQIKQLVIRVLKKYSPYLRLHPAALKNHHSIRSGLLYHTTTMLKLADGILPIYPFLDADLVYAGVILHDICKTTEIEATDAGTAVEYTTEGLLVGHISQGIAAIAIAAEELKTDSEITYMLQHMILSHHYEPEFGSPRRPMFPEAEILHYLDMIDTRMYDMQNVLESQDKGTFSQNVWLLHNRKLYKKTF
ncbi:MAG: HD domain-containing protein [Clostridia bacterium]|nr:HD domain-containing protein [Clostridia bacterium]